MTDCHGDVRRLNVHLTAAPCEKLEAARKHEIKLSVKPVEVCLFPADSEVCIFPADSII